MSRQALALYTNTVTASGAVAECRFVGYDQAQSGAAANTLGASQQGAADGEDLAVAVIGSAVVESGAALVAGAAVETDASGRAVTKAAGPMVGRVLSGQSASAAGEFVEILLIQN